jgi:hypothetical protein
MCKSKYENNFEGTKSATQIQKNTFYEKFVLSYLEKSENFFFRA